MTTRHSLPKSQQCQHELEPASARPNINSAPKDAPLLGKVALRVRPCQGGERAYLVVLVLCTVRGTALHCTWYCCPALSQALCPPGNCLSAGRACKWYNLGLYTKWYIRGILSGATLAMASPERPTTMLAHSHSLCSLTTLALSSLLSLSHSLCPLQARPMPLSSLVLLSSAWQPWVWPPLPLPRSCRTRRDACCGAEMLRCLLLLPEHCCILTGTARKALLLLACSGFAHAPPLLRLARLPGDLPLPPPSTALFALLPPLGAKTAPATRGLLVVTSSWRGLAFVLCERLGRWSLFYNLWLLRAVSPSSSHPRTPPLPS